MLLWDIAFLLSIFAFALAIRTYRLDVFPPGLYTDEAAHGIDALATLDGNYAIFYERNNGREPLFIYLLAAIFYLLGPTAFNIRLAAALCGSMTVVTTYWLFCEMFGFEPENKPQHARWYATWGALFLTFSYWHITFSRLGFRAILTPLIVTIAFALIWRTWRKLRMQKTLPWLAACLGGAALGLSVYTYTAGRVAFVLFLAVAVIMLYFASQLGIDRRRLLQTIALITGVAVIITLPLLTYFALNPRAFGEHAAYVSIFNQELAGNKPVIAFVHSTTKMLLMFFSEIDQNPRHNPARLPVFDPLMAIWLALGIVVASMQWRKPVSLFTLGWFTLFLLPAALTAEGIPHSLRALGMIPIVFALPLIAIAQVGQFLPTKAHFVAKWLPLPFLAVFGVVGLSGYFGAVDRADEFEAPFFVGYWNLAQSLKEIDDSDTIWILPLPKGEGLVDHRLYTADLVLQDQNSLAVLYLDELLISEELAELTRNRKTVNVLHTNEVSGLTDYETRFWDAQGLLNLLLMRNSQIESITNGVQARVPYISYPLIDEPDFAIFDTEQHADKMFGDVARLESVEIGGMILVDEIEQNETLSIPSDSPIWVALRWQFKRNVENHVKLSLVLRNEAGQLAGQVDTRILGDRLSADIRWLTRETIGSYHILEP